MTLISDVSFVVSFPILMLCIKSDICVSRLIEEDVGMNEAKKMKT